jgi:hypothetical protein
VDQAEGLVKGHSAWSPLTPSRVPLKRRLLHFRQNPPWANVILDVRGVMVLPEAVEVESMKIAAKGERMSSIDSLLITPALPRCLGKSEAIGFGISMRTLLNVLCPAQGNGCRLLRHPRMSPHRHAYGLAWGLRNLWNSLLPNNANTIANKSTARTGARTASTEVSSEAPASMVAAGSCRATLRLGNAGKRRP